jgi:hypothetical protein
VTWGEYVEWAIAVIPFAGVIAIPVLVNLATNGWEMHRVSWAAWALSGWLLLVSVMGIRDAIADRTRPPRDQDRHDQDRHTAGTRSMMGPGLHG